MIISWANEKKTKKQINSLLIQAVVLLYGATGERLKEEVADEITGYLKEANKLCEVQMKVQRFKGSKVQRFTTLNPEP